MEKFQKPIRIRFLRSLTKSSIRYLFKHPWQFGLSVIGIAMGVAIVVSIDIANYSSSKAFNISMNSVAGKATHQIKGGSNGIPDSLYTYLKVEKGIRKIAWLTIFPNCHPLRCSLSAHQFNKAPH